MKVKKLSGVILAISIVFSFLQVVPFTATAEYNGTAYTFQNYDSNIYSGGGGVSGTLWSTGTDDGNYLRFKHEDWNDLQSTPAVMSVCSNGQPAWQASDKVGFTTGKTYDITIEYRYPAGDWMDMLVDITLLKDGNVSNYNSAYNQRLFNLKTWQAGSTWQTYNGRITVPEAFDGDASASNFGIVFYADASCWNNVIFDIKSVTIAPVADESESDCMEVDFSGYVNREMNLNSVMMPTSWSSWSVVTQEDGNTYISLTKDKAEAEAEASGSNDTIANGLNVVVNQKAAASYYDDQTPIADSYILNEGTKYFITLRYKLRFTDGESGTLPVKMMHSGYHNTSVTSLADTGIDNTGKRLEESDEWKTVTFAATYLTSGWETWNSFGLSFYDDNVKNRKFELCLDNVIIDTKNNYPELGDVNADGAVDILDLIRMKKYFASEVAEINITAADIDANGDITANDLVMLRQILLGLKKN